MGLPEPRVTTTAAHNFHTIWKEGSGSNSIPYVHLGRKTPASLLGISGGSPPYED